MHRKFLQVVYALAIPLLVGASGCGNSNTEAGGYFDQCEPEMPPSPECFVEKRDPDSDQVRLATAIAERYVQSHPFEAELWDWKSGVLMHALTELYRITGHEWLHSYYQSWLDYHIEQTYQIVWSDSCPPAITAVALLSEASTDEYQQVVDDTLKYLDDVAPRTAEGGISHNGIFGNTPSVWVDSLFMFGMVLNRWGELSDPDRLEMESEQIQIFANLLQDENGFMRHAKDWDEYDESVYWARGNGWVVASLADYLRIQVVRDDPDPEVERVFSKHVAAVVGAQDAGSDLWLTVMSHPDEADNYLETSASALFAYGMARAYRYGVLGDKERAVAQRAIQAIVADRIRLDDDGPVVTGVSLATDPWPLEKYLSVPVADDVNYGVGAVILALIESSGLPE